MTEELCALIKVLYADPVNDHQPTEKGIYICLYATNNAIWHTKNIAYYYYILLAQVPWAHKR